MKSKLASLAPAVNKRVLLVLSGTMWAGVGLLLWQFAYQWLMTIERTPALWLGGGGMGLALLIHLFGFSKLAAKNIQRIADKSNPTCIFSFQSWPSYLNIILMMSLGIALRHSSLPREYLIPLYVGIGGALVLSSLIYFRVFARAMVKEPEK